MAEILGGRDLLTTGKATAAGAISSACTFGAVTITNTLFKKGASSESAFAFSFASTNLVFELGILIYAAVTTSRHSQKLTPSPQPQPSTGSASKSRSL